MKATPIERSCISKQGKSKPKSPKPIIFAAASVREPRVKALRWAISAARRRGVTCPFRRNMASWRSSPSFCTTTGISAGIGSFSASACKAVKRSPRKSSIVASLSAIRPVRVGAGYITRSASPSCARQAYASICSHVSGKASVWVFICAMATLMVHSLSRSTTTKQVCPKAIKKSCTFYSS